MPHFLSISGTPDRSEWHPFQLGYLAHLLPGVGEGTSLGHPDDASAFLKAQTQDLETFLGEVPAYRETFRYAEGKWSLREVMGHLADTERVLAFRALAAARGDVSLLPGFDEDAYALISGHDAIPLHRLGQDLLAVRRATLSLLAGFRTEDWERRGNGNGHPVSARAWAFAIGAHAQLHLGTLRTRYLADL